MIICRNLVLNKFAVYLNLSTKSTSNNLYQASNCERFLYSERFYGLKGYAPKTTIVNSSDIPAKRSRKCRVGNVALNLLMFGLSLALSKSLLCTQHKYGVL